MNWLSIFVNWMAALGIVIIERELHNRLHQAGKPHIRTASLVDGIWGEEGGGVYL
jgi:hypothetical protein